MSKTEGKSSRLSIDISNRVFSNAIIKTKEKFNISKTKAVEVLALEGWKILKGKSEKPSCKDENIELDSYELSSSDKAISQLKINLMKSYWPDPQSDREHKKVSRITVKPIKRLISIQEMVVPDEIYSQKKVNYKYIREVIKSYFESRASEFAKWFHYTPDAILFFATRADVSFHKNSKNAKNENNEPHPCAEISADLFLMKITVNMTCVPVYKERSVMRITDFLDFDGIAYKTFKDVAIHGWNRNIYSHYFYIEDADLYRGGGYFIGLSRQPCQSNFDLGNGYLPSNIATDENGTLRLVSLKFFQEGMSIRITQSGLKMIKEKILKNKVSKHNN